MYQPVFQQRHIRLPRQIVVHPCHGAGSPDRGTETQSWDLLSEFGLAFEVVSMTADPRASKEFASLLSLAFRHRAIGLHPSCTHASVVVCADNLTSTAMLYSRAQHHFALAGNNGLRLRSRFRRANLTQQEVGQFTDVLWAEQ